MSSDRQPPKDERRLILQVIQPGVLGLMDGSVSTLAPLFAAAAITGKPHDAFVVGLAASLGAGISMGLAEALSNDGEISGRGSPLITGNVTGVGTAIGGMGHTFPFLLPKLSAALTLAYTGDRRGSDRLRRRSPAWSVRRRGLS